MLWIILGTLLTEEFTDGGILSRKRIPPHSTKDVPPDCIVRGQEFGLDWTHPHSGILGPVYYWFDSSIHLPYIRDKFDCLTGID